MPLDELEMWARAARRVAKADAWRVHLAVSAAMNGEEAMQKFLRELRHEQ